MGDGFDEAAKPPKSRAERAEGEVERGNHIQRIHDRDKRKVFYHAQAWKRRTQKTETKFQGFWRDARNAASPRKKPWKARLHLLTQITPWHFFALKKGKKMVVGDGTSRCFHSSSKTGCNQLISN